MSHFSVKNFEKFQHYKDRTPPWIKLYNELLDDYEFGQLPDASKWHLLAIWLLASRSNNRIPYDPVWVARRINALDAVDLDLLARSGFIIVDQPLQDVEQNASAPLAKCSLETEGEIEAEKKDSVASATDADGVVDAGSPEHGKLLFRLARKAGRPSAPTEFRKLGLEEYRIEILLRTALAQKEPRSYLAGILNRQRDGPKHWNDHGTESGMSPTLERLIFDEPSTEDRDRDAGTALLAARPGTA